MTIVKLVVIYVLSVYLALLIGRMIISWVEVLSPDWRPSRVVAAVAEVIYSLTDPPLRFLRRFIPSPRIGSVALDLSFMLLFLMVLVLLELASSL